MAKTPPKRKTVDDKDVEAAERGRNDLEAKYFEQLKDLHEARQGINGKISVLRKQAKDAGINSRVLEQAVKDALKSEEQIDDEKAFRSAVEEMKARLGEFINTPLGQAANDTASRRGAAA